MVYFKGVKTWIFQNNIYVCGLNNVNKVFFEKKKKNI